MGCRLLLGLGVPTGHRLIFMVTQTITGNSVLNFGFKKKKKLRIAFSWSSVGLRKAGRFCTWQQLAQRPLETLLFSARVGIYLKHRLHVWETQVTVVWDKPIAVVDFSFKKPLHKKTV